MEGVAEVVLGGGLAPAGGFLAGAVEDLGGVEVGAVGFFGGAVGVVLG